MAEHTFEYHGGRWSAEVTFNGALTPDEILAEEIESAENLVAHLITEGYDEDLARFIAANRVWSLRDFLWRTEGPEVES